MGKSFSKVMFLFVCLILSIGIFMIATGKDIKIGNFSLNNNNKEVTNYLISSDKAIEVNGITIINDKEYNYKGSMEETSVTLEVYKNHQSLPEEAVKKIGSGLLSFEYDNDLVTLLITYAEVYNSDKEENIRDYEIEVSYKDKTETFKKTYENTSTKNNPLVGLTISEIIKETKILD